MREMPELPEVEAWVRELDPLVARARSSAPGRRTSPPLKTFDPPLATLDGRTFAGRRAAAARTCSSRPTDGELVLRVHLMSAGRLRYHAPGAKTPKTPMFRLTFADGGELVLTEAGKKKRAGVWLLTPEALEAELAHLGPGRARARRRSGSARSSRRERRQLHPAAARPAGARGHRPRARERDPLARPALAVQALDRSLGRGEVERLAAAIDEDLTRALALREAGKGDADVYRIHGHFGEPCPLGHDTLRRVDFEEHTITYCPTCQTGGKELKDRRLSRLLR